MTWRGAREPKEGLWPEACRHLFAVLLKCLFITLFQLHLLLSFASHHANPNTPGLSRLIQSMISERREAFPFIFPLLQPKISHPFLPPTFVKSDTLGERTEHTLLKGRGKEGGGRAGWIEEKRGMEVSSMLQRLLNWFQSSSWTPGMCGTHCRLAVFAFVGCRKFDHYPCCQPTSHPSPPRMMGKEDSHSLTGINDTSVIGITNIKSECRKKCTFHSNVEWLHHTTCRIISLDRK